MRDASRVGPRQQQEVEWEDRERQQIPCISWAPWSDDGETGRKQEDTSTVLQMHMQRHTDHAIGGWRKQLGVPGTWRS